MGITHCNWQTPGGVCVSRGGGGAAPPARAAAARAAGGGWQVGPAGAGYVCIIMHMHVQCHVHVPAGRSICDGHNCKAAAGHKRLCPPEAGDAVKAKAPVLPAKSRNGLPVAALKSP